MRPLDAAGNQEARDLELLLRAAAEFEPDQAPPEDLALRALARLEGTGRRGGRPAFLGALLAGALAVPAAAVAAALLFAPATEAPVRMPAAPPRPAANGSLSADLARDPAPARQGDAQSAARTISIRTAVAPPAAFGSRPRSLPGRLTSRRHRSRPLAARWEVETVRNEAPRVETPAWMIEPGESDGSLVFTPGILSVALQPGDRSLLPAPDPAVPATVNPAVPVKENP